MFKIINEGKAKIEILDESKISKKLPVFYNPVMKFNRDMSILLLNSIPDKDLQIAMPLAGSGIRGIRFLLELKKNKIKSIYFNDMKEDFFDVLKNNFSLNKLPEKEILLFNQDANIFLLESTGFDYIDVDPFGSPNPFLDSAMRRISRGGILAVTATDTSALCGTYEHACKRKYWAVPLRNELQHEFGIRILIRKVQLVAAQYEKALTPILSYDKDHYMRVIFRCEKSKEKVNELLNNHGLFDGAGPIWLGDLWDKKLLKDMIKNSVEHKEFLKSLLKEAEVGGVGFYDIHKICEIEKIYPPKFEVLMEKVKKKGYKISRTHFNRFGMKTNIERKKLVKIIQQLF